MDYWLDLAVVAMTAFAAGLTAGLTFCLTGRSCVNCRMIATIGLWLADRCKELSEENESLRASKDMVSEGCPNGD